jgi:PAS domain S-box-containing protein
VKPDLQNSVGLNAAQLRRILREPEFFQLVFNALPLQIAVKSTREENFGEFLLWNRVAEEWTGLSAAEVIGKNDSDFFPREQADFFIEKDREVVRTGQSVDIPEELIQTRTRGPRHLHTIKTPIFDETGEPLALLAVSEDITDRKRTADELTTALRRLGEERNLFQSLLNHLPVCAFAKSALPENFGTYILWNRVMEELHGKPAGEVLGHTTKGAFDARTAEIFDRQDREAIETGKVVEVPLQAVEYARAGKRLVRAIKAPVFADDGSPMAVVGIAEDITDRIHSEAERARATDMLRQVTNRVPGAIYQLIQTPAGIWKFTYVSDRMEEVLGVPNADLLTNAHPAFECVIEADRPRVFAAIDQARATHSVLQIDFRIQRRDDGRLRWLEINSVPQPHEEGTMWFGFVTDVTERQCAEEALRESEERWNLALAGTEAGVWDWNLRTGALFYSARWQELFGYSDAKLPPTARDLLDLVHPDDRSRVRSSTIDLLRRRSELFRCEYRMRRNDGSYVWILAHAKAHFDPEGNATRMIGTLIDITARKNIEAQLVEAKIAAENANRAKGDFLAMMSHEIRTPLNGVLGFTELLATTALQPTQSEYLHTIRDSGSNLLHVLNDILDYSKIESGKLTLENQPTSLAELIHAATETFRAKAAERNLELTSEVAPGAPAIVVVDALRLRQILANLISNAIKFTTTGSVRVRAEVAPERASEGFAALRFTVADSGIGISHDDLPRLFEPFEQLDISMARRFGGTGLGLSIVHRLVGMMGGKISATSEPGQGTTFTIDLTLPVRDGKAAETRPAAEESAKASRQAAILLVDDHAVNRRLARLMLQRLGHEPVEAADGEQAVELAAAKTYDVIFMDIQMPGMDGYEAARLIRNISPDTFIVALTAHALSADRERSAESGMHAHLTKPVRMDDLRAVLAEQSARAFKNQDIG